MARQDSLRLTAANVPLPTALYPWGIRLIGYEDLRDKCRCARDRCAGAMHPASGFPVQLVDRAGSSAVRWARALTQRSDVPFILGTNGSVGLRIWKEMKGREALS